MPRFIDECNRLWMVDVGRSAGVQVCPMKIMIFDLITDQLVHKYEIPRTEAFGMASLVTPIVEVGATCLKSVLYIADVAEYGIVVYDLEADRSWRLNNTRGNAFGPDSDATNITIANESFDLTDGTLGMSLSPPAFFKERATRFKTDNLSEIIGANSSSMTPVKGSSDGGTRSAGIIMRELC
ncbi:hypothetical protein PV326_010071 [Microctonus aethiopoides]|nr:hypothetical protein PV326_010071 [Microctonus aethiopoides]